MADFDTSFMDGDQPPSFNLGLATVNRINNGFIQYSEWYVRQEWASAFIQLDIVSQEIDPFLTKEEKEKSKEQYSKIQKEIKKIEGNMNQGPSGKSMLMNSELPKELREWSLLLRTQSHKHKLYMPLSSDPRFATAR